MTATATAARDISTATASPSPELLGAAEEEVGADELIAGLHQVAARTRCRPHRHRGP